VRKRQRLLLSDESTENFWPSFTDLISTVSMILFVLVLLAYIQNLISAKQLSATKRELENSGQRILATRAQLSDAEKKLQSLGDQIRAGQALLADSRAQLEAQQAKVQASNREISDLRAKVEGIAVLRVSVLQKVKQSIDAQLQSELRSSPARIADNGNIAIDESVVFESNQYTLRPGGQEFLKAVAKAFANVLRDPNVRSNIDVVSIQGHTDERGTVQHNRDLSAKRANAVLDYMFEVEPELAEQYGSYFAASAFSEFRPLRTEKNEAAYQQNRRIEISVVLKDTGLRTVIDDYMKEQQALFPTQEPAK